MPVGRLLRIASGKDRRKSPRVYCRLRCTLRTGRRWLPARILDVSQEGLCLLSPVRLEPKRQVRLRVDVPRVGSVAVEAVVWHVRRVKSDRTRRKAWSTGMMISKADDGFRALLPDADPSGDSFGAEGPPPEPPPPASRPAAGSSPEPEPPLEALEEDALTAEELEELDLEFLSPDELEAAPSIAGAPPDDTLRIFRVRVKAKTGPRTKTLTLGAVSPAEAETLARAELDESWRVFEVVPA